MQISRCTRPCTVLQSGPHTRLRGSWLAKKKNGCKVVPQRKYCLPDEQSFSMPSARSTMCGGSDVTVQLPRAAIHVTGAPRPAWCLMTVLPSRDDELLLPGRRLRRHSRREEALRRGFHKRLTQAQLLPRRISASAPYVCPPRLGPSRLLGHLKIDANPDVWVWGEQGPGRQLAPDLQLIITWYLLLFSE